MTVHWTEAALADLQAIEAYIRRHSRQYAQGMVERIFARTAQLSFQPLIAPMLPK
jgi:plasmid stabilization system protein ParE